MYILSDLNGNLIQKSNVEVKDFQKLIDRFSNELGVEVIGTDNELLFSKTEETDYFDIIIENNEIVDIVPKENLTHLGQFKTEIITQSKQLLEEFLQNNPLQFKDGKFYSVTKEKQTLLANALQVYQMKVQAGMTPILTWNATGEKFTEWTLENLTLLALSIADYVEPLVTQQQALEVQIRNASTSEELAGITIEYKVV